ncbi:MAG: molecular chaperone DnaK [Deltaproteobacteria bacterium]|nr:molecular chaperone DnaK [Deltaproteobacteria bacterium]
MDKAIGIDLGTTYSVAAVIEAGRARVIPNAEGETLTPSVVAETASGTRLAGSVARRQASANPHNTVRSIKRHMGRDYRVFLNGRAYSPQEISAFILRKIKTDAEAHLKMAVKNAVVTVPAYFTDAQRQATYEAATLAGLKVMRIINEPTAAALAYGLDREKIQTILVWDLGGGTFDVSILELGDGMFHVKSVNGNTGLGGDDWDERLVDHLCEEIFRHFKHDIRSSATELEQLREVAEKSKRALSTRPKVNVPLRFLKMASSSLEHERISVTRKDFEAITADLREALLAPTRQALRDARLTPDQIDRVVLVGGSTRMPAVRRLVEEIFNRKPFTRINPDEVVGIGAAVQAGILTGEIDDVVLVDVTPLSLGIETEGGLFARIIERNATIPTSAGQIFTNAEDNQMEMDFHVLQGEREMAEDNISLGRFKLTGLPPLPRGKGKVEVNFRIDVNGIVTVYARDLYTEQETGIEIDASHLLSDEEVALALQEAENAAREDTKRREETEINIRADGMIRAAEHVLQKDRKKRIRAFGEQIEDGIFNLKEALFEGDSHIIKDLTGQLRALLKEAK